MQWQDAGNAKGVRPGSVSVTLLADGQAIDSVPAEETKFDLWHFSFKDVPAVNADGEPIEYSVKAEAVQGYDAACEKIIAEIPEGSSETAGEAEDQNMFMIVYTLVVSDEEKTPAEVSALPDPRETEYTGEEQILVKKGEAEGGTMMYAVGESAEAAPDASAYSEELPAGINAGDYYIWYYVKGDLIHTDTAPACLETPAVIGKIPVTVQALDQAIERDEEADSSLEYAVLTDAVKGHTLSKITLTADSTAQKVIASDAIIVDAEGTPATDNYEIAYKPGKLTVKGQVICIRQNSDGTWPEGTEGAAAIKRPGTGESFTVTEETAGLYSEDHYVLKGYSTGYNSDGSCTAVSGGQTIGAEVSADLYLYYALESHTLTFCGDTEGTEIFRTETVYYGTALSGFKNVQPEARPNYTFAAWATEPGIIVDGLYEADEVTPNPVLEGKLVDWETLALTDDMAVYPIWIHDRLKVVIDPGADDAFLDEEQARDFTVDLNEKVAMRNLVNASRPGYELAGWYTQRGVLWNGENWKTLSYVAEGWDETAGWGVTPEYCDKDNNGNDLIRKNRKRKFSYYTVTLTAHWTPKKVLVRYNPGDHPLYEHRVPNDMLVTYGSTTELAQALDAEPGYEFTGWKAPDGKLYSAGGTFRFDNWNAQDNPDAAVGNTITLTAQYVERNRVTLRFDANGGTAVEPLTDYEGDIVNLLDPRFATTRTGYTFDGWYNVENEICEGEYTFTQDEVLTAQWTANKYTISFDYAGGGSDMAVTMNYGASVTAPTDPKKVHYTFKGWMPAIPETMPAENLTVKAVWAPVSYTITFEDPDGGNTIDGIEGFYGAPVTAPEDPEWEGYTFCGWKDSNGNDAVIPSYMPDTNPTYTAKWKQNQDAPSLSAEAADAHTIRVNNPAADAEYLILGTGKTPTDKDWDSAISSGDGTSDVAWTDLLPGEPYVVWARKPETGDKAASEAVSTTVTTPKEDQAAPAAPNAKALSEDTVIVTVTAAGAEYALVEKGKSPDAWITPDENGEVRWEDLKEDTEYEVYARMKGSDRQNASDPSEAAEVKTPVHTHNWGEWQVVKAPTETTEGRKVRTCSICQDDQVDRIPVIVKYTVTYSVVNGTWANGSAEVQTERVEEGETPAAIPAGMKPNTGYADGAWDTDPTGAVISSNTTFTYTFKEVYTVTFNANGGTVSPASGTTGGDGKLASLPTPTLSGKVFDGWFTEKTDGEKVTAAAVFTSDATVYAHWEDNAKPETEPEKETEPGKEETKPDEPGKEETTAADSGKVAPLSPEKAPTVKAADKAMAKITGNGDPKGSNFGLLRAKAKKIKTNSVTLSWTRVKGAKGYIIYGNKCGKKNKYLKLATIKKAGTLSKKITKIRKIKLKKGTYYKFIVAAYALDSKGVKKVIATSKSIHFMTKGNEKYGDFTSVKVKNVKKKKLTLKKGKTFKLKAVQVKPENIKVKQHRKLSYESSNKKVVSVNKKGKIKARKAGTCTIYIYAQNGLFAKVKVKVK